MSTDLDPAPLTAGPFVDLARLTHPGDDPAPLPLDGSPLY